MKKKQSYNLKLYLSYKKGDIIGIVRVYSIHKDTYLGKIEFTNFPEKLKNLFELHEEFVNSQIFSLTDDLENQIEEWELKLNGIRIYDIQIMNSDDISFKSNIPLVT